MKNRTIKVDYLARVEGEGALFVKIKDNAVSDVRLEIFEPPRFFEAFLRGRNFAKPQILRLAFAVSAPWLTR
jgi:sulfhydrogenase subunit alpha